MTSRLIPLVILLVVIIVLAMIVYIGYSIVQDVSNQTRTKMEKRNVMFTKDGMKVGVREVKEEDYVDQTQSILVNMWNHTSFPAYKSRLWDMTASGSGSGSGSENANGKANGKGRVELRKGNSY